jgi:hypothetical protein
LGNFSRPDALPIPIVDDVPSEEIAPERAPGDGASRFVAVVLDNHVDARPISALAASPFVHEIPVEGGMTRYLALYPYDAAPEIIGPVRSLRPYMLDFAESLDAALLHVGGSPAALTEARRSPLARLNQFFDPFFWRARDRYAPHNVYTSGEELLDAFADREYRAIDEAPAWTYAEDVPDGDPVTRLIILYPRTGHSIAWEWNEEDAVFERRLAGKKHVDRDGDLVTAKNVLVQRVRASVLDDVGRLSILTVDTGDAMMLRDGKIIEGTWRRTVNDRTRFYVDGTEHVMAPGTTWIQVVSTSTRVTVE